MAATKDDGHYQDASTPSSTHPASAPGDDSGLRHGGTGGDRTRDEAENRYEAPPPSSGFDEAPPSPSFHSVPPPSFSELLESANVREERGVVAEPGCVEFALGVTSPLLSPLLLLLMLWAVALCFVEADALPGGPLFRLVSLFAAARAAGGASRLVVPRVPALVATMLVGLAARNLGLLDQLPPDYVVLVADLRKVALALIMVRAGLGLDPSALRSLSLLVLALAVLPATVEVAALVGLGRVLLGLPPLWGVLLGLVLCAVAPSVVMPCFVELRAHRLGTDKGIDTLVVAAASFDDVIAISLFGLVQSLIFNGDTSLQEVLQHPLGLLFGILYGVCLGTLLRSVPSRDTMRVALWRFTLLLGGGLAVTFGSEALGYHEAASVGCIATALCASAGWRAKEGALAVDDVEAHFEVLWAVFEPIMFSLIGADIDVAVLDGAVVGLALACILLALAFRTLSTWLLLLLLGGGRFNWKERLFVALAWLPKADVQAALGPLALDAARRAGRGGEAGGQSEAGEAQSEAEAHAGAVLLMAVLSILLTAPAGSVLIAVLSRRLLAPASTTTSIAIVVEAERRGGNVSNEAFNNEEEERRQR